MTTFFQGLFAGIAMTLCVYGIALVTDSQKYQGLLGATPSSGDFIGIYNTTPTDLGLRDGYGSALSVDQNGRLILVSQ